MQKITILSLAVAISMMSYIVPVAEAEPISPPYQQVRDGTPVGEVVCAGDRMLMLSPSGMPACVFAGSVEALERRGFVLLSEVPRDDLSAKQSGASEKAGGTGSPDASKAGDRPFVTTWRTASPNESITIPVGRSTGAYAVDWGDGAVTSATGDVSHAYASPGEHQVVISGDFTRIYLNGSPNAEKLQSIDQWGDIQWESMNLAFGGATNMAYRATDVPDLSGVTDMSGMFAYADSFNGDISEWDVSGVTDMSRMFAYAYSFNGDISPWDVSGVADMSWMFSGADSFNGDISEWDVSGVADMSWMFSGADSFNGDISEWDVSGVADMSWMFSGADSFNGDISEWDVSGVADMSEMFAYADSFSGDLSPWDVSGVADMSWMFSGADSFNGDLSPWDVSGVADMSWMFSGADSFNGDLSPWDVSGVADMSGMFAYTTSFNGDISDWDVSSVTDMSKMFRGATSFNGDISPWDVSGVADMSWMFNGADSFNGDLSPWDVSGVADMSWMFNGADSFNGDLSPWDVSSVTDMSKMFRGATSFNGDISPWDVSGVADMSWMFSGADSFNGDISEWDVSGVADMSEMFAYADSFNGDLSPWDVSSVTDMSKMFRGATSFNGDISPWDVSGVAGMSGMFLHADSFIQNLGSWYITLDGTPIDGGDATRAVGNISAQNSFLSGQDPTYGIGLGGDSELFELDGTSLKQKTIPNHLTKESYTVNITSTGTFGTNNFRIFDIAVSEGAAVGPLDSYANSLPTAYADFITTWKTTQPGETVTIPVEFPARAYTVDWGDGTVTSVTGDASHAYASPGEYQVVISGDFTRIYLIDGPNAEKLQSIDQWGDIQWESMSSAFGGATNMVYRANDAPNLSNVTDMSKMFLHADSFNGDLSDWDVSGVTDMSGMFGYASSFNGDISPWDVSGVTDMSGMFGHADSFTQNLGSWYITLDDTSIDDGDATRTVGNISAQNSFLGGQSLRYSIAPGGDGDAFEIDGTVLKLKSTPNHASKGSYTVTISSTGGFGTSNSETFEIRVV